MLKILIAEDELPERRGLQALLERYYGDRLTICGAAGNGREALELFRRLRPDMVLMDINMPEMDGLEAAERLRREASDLPIVIVTAYSLFEYARKAILIGVADYIVKPYSIKTLRQTMDRVLHQGELRRESMGSRAGGVGTESTRPSGTAGDGLPEDVSKAENPGDGGGRPRERGLCDTVKLYIESRYQKEISLDDIALHAGVSKYHLSRIFSETEGLGIKEFHIRIRIREARYYLGLGYTVAEAAYAVGFKDPNYFSRIVKKYTGRTARELGQEQ